jgi:hypothetical protein
MATTTIVSTKVNPFLLRRVRGKGSLKEGVLIPGIFVNGSDSDLDNFDQLRSKKKAKVYKK